MKNNYFLKLFLKNKGNKILSFSLMGKLLGVLSSIVIVRILSVADFGEIQYALALVALITPFIGFGANLSLLRFGSVINSNLKRKLLYNATQRYGFIFSLFIIVIILFLNETIPLLFSVDHLILIILSTKLIFDFVLSLQQNYIRILGQNSFFANTQLFLSVSLLFFNVIFSYWRSR